jgi:hypothetical protein
MHEETVAYFFSQLTAVFEIAVADNSD